MSDISARMDQIAAPLLVSLQTAQARLLNAPARWLCITEDGWFCLGRMGDGPEGLIDLRGSLFGAESWAEAEAIARAKAWNEAGLGAPIEAVLVSRALDRMVLSHTERLSSLGQDLGRAETPSISERGAAADER
jgi:hypothetical protein